jgi:hypothetical protein
MVRGARAPTSQVSRLWSSNYDRAQVCTQLPVCACEYECAGLLEAHVLWGLSLPSSHRFPSSLLTSRAHEAQAFLGAGAPCLMRASAAPVQQAAPCRTPVLLPPQRCPFTVFLLCLSHVFAPTLPPTCLQTCLMICSCLSHVSASCLPAHPDISPERCVGGLSGLPQGVWGRSCGSGRPPSRGPDVGGVGRRCCGGWRQRQHLGGSAGHVGGLPVPH